MRELIVLYDDACPFCVSCRRWLEARDAWMRLRFLPCRSAFARQQFGSIPGLVSELVVVDSRGRYWVGPAAFLVCGWALSAFSGIAEILASELLWPLARRAFHWIGDHRA